MKWQKSQHVDLTHEARVTTAILLHVISTILISDLCVKNQKYVLPAPIAVVAKCSFFRKKWTCDEMFKVVYTFLTHVHLISLKESIWYFFAIVVSPK